VETAATALKKIYQEAIRRILLARSAQHATLVNHAIDPDSELDRRHIASGRIFDRLV